MLSPVADAVASMRIPRFKRGSRNAALTPAGAFLRVASVMAVIAIPLWWYTFAAAGPPTRADLIVAAPILLGAFLLTEVLPLRVEVRSETSLITLVEIPVIFGLLLGVWPPVVAAANVAAGLIIYLVRGNKPSMVAANLCLILAESGLVSSIFVAAIRTGVDTSVRYGVLAAAVLLSAVLSSLTVSLAHRLLGTFEKFGPAVVRALITSGATTTVALVGVELWRTDDNRVVTLGRILCLALGLAIFVLYRIYSSFLRQHLDLSAMYEFGRRVTDIEAASTDWPDLLAQIREQLNAHTAAVYLREADGSYAGIELRADGSRHDTAAPADDRLLQLSDEAGGVQLTAEQAADRGLAGALARRRADDVLVVPLRSGNRARGHVEVRDRINRWSQFSGSDLRILGTLAQHIATALDNQRLVETLRHEAHHDSITGLLNWRGLLYTTERELAAGGLEGVLLVALGILPEVNNAIGHERGEHLLIAAGERLAGELPGTPLVAHLDSDRFGVLVRAGDHPEQVALQLLEVVSRTFPLDGFEVEPHARVGVASLVDDRTEPEPDAGLLWQRADMALTAAANAEVSLRSYGPALGEVFRRRFHLVTQFRRAVEHGLITVAYQPKLSLADRKLSGVEALVRWSHPEFGSVSPAEFVEAIEATGSIDILFDHVLDIVLAQLAEWNRRRIRIGVAVNLSVRNLAAPDFVRRVAQALARFEVAPELITFEITESSVMSDPERSLPILRELHDLGIALSVDDFGTGYSSLAYLRRLPIDEIKIDRSFVQGMITDLNDLAIVRAIIDLGHSLGLRVVAEGVEEEAARDALRTLHCDDLQGYLLSRPLTIDKLESWFTSRTVSGSFDGAEAHPLRLVGG